MDTWPRSLRRATAVFISFSFFYMLLRAGFPVIPTANAHSLRPMYTPTDASYDYTTFWAACGDSTLAPYIHKLRPTHDLPIRAT